MELPALYSKLSQRERNKAREEYVKIQGGRCFWCNAPLNQQTPQYILALPINLSLFPRGFLKNPIHLQHDHRSDLTEGAVHAYCNAVMWQYYGR